jgi:DNA modification methylase
VNIYSVSGDTVLDPFWGTGTTSLAAMIAGRHSVGDEREDEFRDVFADRVSEIERLSRETIRQRCSNVEEAESYDRLSRLSGTAPN